MRKVNLDTDVLARWLWYGQPGSTKTRTAASAALDPRMAPALMVSMAGNPLSIRDYEKRPDVVEIENYKELNNIYSFFDQGQPSQGMLWEALGKPDTRANPYKTLIIDGLTNLQRRAAQDALGASAILPGDIPPPMQQQHHGQVLSRMLVFADKFFQLPLHVIITALEYEQWDSAQNAYYRVQLTGQASSEVPSYAMLVGRLLPRDRVSASQVTSRMAEAIRADIERDPGTDSIMLLRPTQKYYAKNQYCKGPPYLINPTCASILDMVLAGD